MKITIPTLNWFAVVLVLVGAVRLKGQTVSQNSDQQEQVVQMSQFIVTTTQGMGYVDANAVSGFKTNQALLDVPQAEFIFTNDLLRDLGATNKFLSDSLMYAGVATWFRTGEQGAMVRQLGVADSRMTQIGRAIRWVRDHYAETLRIEDLASVAGMSLTSFHRHFVGVTSLSPLQFQKQIRLQEARSRLLSSLQDVAAVGYSVGYDSTSHT